MSIYGNRGGRGWQEPQRTVRIDHAEMVRRAMEAHGFKEAPSREVYEAACKRDAIIDLVEHNGVWMTPEDAEKARA